MKCPYCGKEMDRGELVSSHGIHWYSERVPDGQPDHIPLTKTTIKGFFTALSEGYSVEAHHCPDCKAIILFHE